MEQHRYGRPEGTGLVIGVGRSGRAAVELICARGGNVYVYDDSGRKLAGFLKSAPPRCSPLHHGEDIISSGEVSYVVASPGVHPDHDLVEMAIAGGIPVISELELGWFYADSPCVLVTGTNGKSSTTTMIRCLLEQSGISALAVGNIGLPFSAAVARSADDGAPDWYVVEASSYQLFFSPGIHPKVLVYTNYAPDHLGWHGSEQAYVQAKASVSSRLDEGDVIVYPDDDSPLTRAVSGSSAGHVVIGASSDVELDTDTGRLRLGGEAILDLDAALPELPYSWRLVSCAIACTAGVARALAIEPARLLAALGDFRPLEHRLEEVSGPGDVCFINDSKATNIDATSYALRMCEGPLVLLLGGRDKGVGYDELIPFFESKVICVTAFGEAREKIKSDLGDSVRVIVRAGFEDALDEAYRQARAFHSPATVLLSPACSSFDMFSDFEERGRCFKNWVTGLGGRR